MPSTRLNGVLNHVVGDVGEPAMFAAGSSTQPDPGRRDRELLAVREHPHGPLDDDTVAPGAARHDARPTMAAQHPRDENAVAARSAHAWPPRGRPRPSTPVCQRTDSTLRPCARVCATATPTPRRCCARWRGVRTAASGSASARSRWRRPARRRPDNRDWAFVRREPELRHLSGPRARCRHHRRQALPRR